MFGRYGLVLTAVVSATALAGPVTATTVGPHLLVARDEAAEPRPHGFPAFAFGPGVVGVAHRGASEYAPENTLAAFRTAARMGADMFELDVQETKDHRLVVLHDSTLARTTDVEDVFPGREPWKVSEFTLDEVKRLDAGSWFGRGYRGERVPTLSEVARAMRGSGLGMLVELKNPSRYPGIERRVAEVLRRDLHWMWPDPEERRLIVQSFDRRSVRSFHGIAPKVPTGVLGRPEVSALPELARYSDLVNPDHRELTASYVGKVHAADMDVFAWTVDDAGRMRTALDRGVDGIITNRPDVFRDVRQAAA